MYLVFINITIVPDFHILVFPPTLVHFLQTLAVLLKTTLKHEIQIYSNSYQDMESQKYKNLF